MSPLGGWFRKDWTAVLAEARELLGEGEPVNALRLALRVAGKAEEGLAVRARALAVEARAAVVASVMAKAEAAEAKGDWADAADWLLSAIEHLGDDPRADELAARREGLLTRLDEEASPFVNAGRSRPPSSARRGSRRRSTAGRSSTRLCTTRLCTTRPWWRCSGRTRGRVGQDARRRSAGRWST